MTPAAEQHQQRAARRSCQVLTLVASALLVGPSLVVQQYGYAAVMAGVLAASYAAHLLLLAAVD